MEKLEEGFYYHIYNRGINSGPICFEENHYNKFLRTSYIICTLQLKFIATVYSAIIFTYWSGLDLKRNRKKLFLNGRKKELVGRHMGLAQKNLRFSCPQHSLAIFLTVIPGLLI